MNHPHFPRRRYSSDQPPWAKSPEFLHGPAEGNSNSIRLSPEREIRAFNGDTDKIESYFDVSYGGEPILLHPPREPQFTEEEYIPSIIAREIPLRSHTHSVESSVNHGLSFVEGIENDWGKPEEVENAGLSKTTTLPATNEQSMLYPNLSIWGVEKNYDRKIGTTNLQSIYSIKYSTGEMGQGKATLFCPEGPTRDDDYSPLLQAKWLHVQRPSMSIKVLEKLVMGCPMINGDIRRVAILLLEAVEKSFLREAENGAYIEPGSVLRFSGTRPTVHQAYNLIATEPVIFIAFPFVELGPSRDYHESQETDEYYPRTLLQNLYGFDVVTSRGKHQVIHKMPVGSRPNDTLLVNQLWCLVIGSDILITMSDRPADDLLGGTIEKRTDFFRQPLRIDIVDLKGFQHSMSISSKTSWVDFFRHVIFTVHGNLIKIMDYELVDALDEVVTPERWVKIAKAARPSLLKFHLVERKTPTSRSSSVSSRRSSRSGIERLLLLDFTHHDKSNASKSHHREDMYDEDSSSSERRFKIKRALTPERPYSYQHSKSSIDAPRYENKTRLADKQSGLYPEANNPSLHPQYAPTVITLDSSDEDSMTEGLPMPTNSSSNAENGSEIEDCPQKNSDPVEGVSASPEHQQTISSDNVDQSTRATGSSPRLGHSSTDEQNTTTATSTTQLRKTAGYRKVQVEDGSESPSEDGTNRRASNDLSSATFLPDRTSATLSSDTYPVMEDTKNDFRLSPQNWHDYGDRENSLDNRNGTQNSVTFSSDVSYGGFMPRSNSPSSSTDESFHSRGRSRTRKRKVWGWESPDLDLDSSPRSGVRFQPEERHFREREIVETSPYSSSNATKVESLPTEPTVPFFFWKQNTAFDTAHDIQEQDMIKLLDQIDERLSDDPISKYYSKVPELTMGDVLARQESLHETVLERDLSIGHECPGQLNRFGAGRITNPVVDGISTISSSESKMERTTGLNDASHIERVKGLGISSDQERTKKTKDPGGDVTITVGNESNSTHISTDREDPIGVNFCHTQALGLISHDKILAKQLVSMSQKIIWSFTPKSGGSVIHTLLKRFWGCVDIICLQLLWEENQRGDVHECTYIIRDFSNQVKKSYLQRRKQPSGKINYLDCGDCKFAKPYQSAMAALKHLHEMHIDCPHGVLERPYDDPCYVWLHRIWHDGYPIRSRRDGLLGVMEDFLEALSYINNSARELQSMTTRDSSANDTVSTPTLPTNIIRAFQQIVKMFVFRSKQISLINRRRSLVGGSSLENFPLVQRIDRKIEELLTLEMEANERIIDLLESSKKDIFLSGVGSHSAMLQAETVRAPFLALAFMSGIQKPLLQPYFMSRSYVKDTLLQLYKDYTSRLHFQANDRPRKRVFLDIHGLEEELQALDKLVGSQESCLYNVLTLIDPLTSRYTTETRLREFRTEVQYGNVHLHQLIERRRDIDNLATRLYILKDQVKQTIEIMEEDHGKAIRVFTVVTLFFLPLSFVSSFLGMNTVDVRSSDWNQQIFWITGIPITVAVLSLAFIYGYKGEEIRDWMNYILQDRGRQYSSTFHDTDGRMSLETRLKEQNPATTIDQNTLERRDFGAVMRSRMKNISGWQRENFKGLEGPDGRGLIRRRNTEDSLAPMRR